MALNRHDKRWHTRRTLYDRLFRPVRVADLAKEYPIQWVEELDETGNLVDAPGTGHRAIWKNSDCSFGSSLVLNCTDPFYSTDEHLNLLRRCLSQVVLQLDYGEELQFLWFPWDDAHELIDRYRCIRSDDPPFLKWWRRNRSEREFSRMQSGDLRTFRSILSLNISPDRESKLLNPHQITPGVGEVFGLFDRIVDLSSILSQNLNALNPDQYKALARKMHTRMSHLTKILSDNSGSFECRPWTAPELFHFLRRQWSPDQWQVDRVLRGGQHTIPRADARWAPFASYFLPPSYELSDEGDLFKFGPYWHRVLVMNTLPEEVDVGDIPSVLTIPENVRGIKNITVAMTVRGMDNTVEMEKLRKLIRHFRGQMKGSPEHGDNEAIIKNLTQRILQLRTATRPEMFYTNVHVHLWEKDREKLHEHEQLIKASLSGNLRMSVECEDHETLPFVIGFEQPGYTRYPETSRAHSLVGEEVAAMAPISAYNDGCINPGRDAAVPLLLETDTGVPQGIDIWADKKVTNYGGVWVGQSGSGKSNLLQQVMLAYAYRDTDIFVVDGAESPSYLPICTLLGGTYVQFNETLKLNPLATKIGPDGQQLNPTSEELTHILITLGAMFRPAKRLQAIESSVLTNAVRFIFENRSGDQSRVRLPDLRRGLAPARFDSDPTQRGIASEFLRILEETWLGRYGEMMSGTEELPHSWFTVFDVRWLSSEGQDQLQAVVVSLLFRFLERISRENIERPDGLKRQILAVIDEAWKAAKNPAMLQQIIAGYRTGRARHMSMNLASQSMKDVLDLLQMNEDGDRRKDTESSPILENCSHHFLFTMNEKSALQAAEAFSLNETQRKALLDLKGERNVFREFIYLVKTSGKQGRVFTKLRSRILPEEVWATTTSRIDGARRTAMNTKVSAELKEPGSRRKMISELRAANWDIDETTTDEMLRQSVVIHRLAREAL